MSETFTIELEAAHAADWRKRAEQERRSVEETIVLELRLQMYGALAFRGMLPSTPDAIAAHFRRRAPIKHMMPAVWRKSGGLCVYCGSSLDPYEGWHMDHVVPFSRGGTDDVANLVASCAKCNLAKRNTTVADFSDRRKAQGA